jgi:glycosyltransferase involved in cell wall biosynthesis
VAGDNSAHRVALVVPGLAYGREGGVPSVAGFLYRVLSNSEQYHPELISLATSSKDRASVRMLAPPTWVGGVQTTRFFWQGIPAVHVGARFVELEFQRYRPRRLLGNLLKNYDLVQIVAGSPAAGVISKDVTAPVVLQVATLAAVERETKLIRERHVRGIWARMMTKITNRLDHKALQTVDHVFVENSWMYHYLKRRLGPHRVTLAPPGVDTGVFKPAPNFPAGGFILSVGRFRDPRKNVSLLFNAYHALSKLMPDPPLLVLAGSSMPDHEDWRVALDLGIADRVRLYENVSNTELVELYQGARLFVLSSNEEGLGIVLLEAMASAVPVVATRCGGPEAVVLDGETGFLVPLNDPHLLAEKMFVLLQDAEFSRRLGQKGRRRVVKNYSEEAAGQAFLQVYDSLVEKRGR